LLAIDGHVSGQGRKRLQSGTQELQSTIGRRKLQIEGEHLSLDSLSTAATTKIFFLLKSFFFLSNVRIV
jgi:hypothetical protein